MMYPSVWEMLDKTRLTSRSDRLGEETHIASEEQRDSQIETEMPEIATEPERIANSPVRTVALSSQTLPSDESVENASVEQPHTPDDSSRLVQSDANGGGRTEQTQDRETEGFRKSSPFAPYANRFEPRSSSEKSRNETATQDTPRNMPPDPGPAPEIDEVDEIDTAKVAQRERLEKIDSRQPRQTHPRSSQEKSPDSETVDSDREHESREYNNLDDMTPLEKVEAFRDSPLDFDCPARVPSHRSSFGYYRSYQPQ